MMYAPIQIKNLTLSFPHKICFQDFSSQIPYASRIAIIGRNGSGKSSLLNILNGTLEPTNGSIQTPDNVRVGYVPQLFADSTSSLSGGQRFNAALTNALSLDPDVLLLDEPTNNLDANNRTSLMRMLRSFPGTLIVVSHDVELLRNCIDTLWHIDDGQIHIFSGNYDDYIRERTLKRSSIEQELSRLGRQKKDTHHALMKEQTRASKSSAKGKKSVKERKWSKVTAKQKAMSAESAAGSKSAEIGKKKEALSDALKQLHLPEIILPTFSLTPADIGSKTVVSIREGTVGYKKDEPLLQDIHLSVGAGERIAIMGDNGSGKSTLIKGILHNPHVVISGEWHVPKQDDIGYLDQHYATLNPHQSVFETIETCAPTWSHAEIRKHLNDFLFRKNEEVMAHVATLSGGERVRLALAQIAAKTPHLLILDEITNNIDLETREHVTQVLKEYPGTVIVISHEESFLTEIGIKRRYQIKEGYIIEVQ